MGDALAALAPRISLAETAKDALRLLSEQDFDVAVLDVMLPDASGFEIHQWVQERAGAPPVVFVTVDDTLEHAVDALRGGAVHYVVKRRNYLERMVKAVSEALEMPRARGVSNSTSGADEGKHDVIVGNSRAIAEVRRKIVDFGATSATVLISGETGTGKELVARAIHRASRRRSAPFVVMNCAGVTEALLATSIIQVSGAGVRSAGSGTSLDLRAAAQGGTLFLDEIDDVPLSMQGKFLRLLDAYTEREGDAKPSREPEVRVIAATKRNLENKVAVGELRPDLYHRLNVLRLHLPPLRERREDIRPLAEYFLGLYSRSGNCPVLTQEAVTHLVAAPWVGNVRELEHAIQRTLAAWTVGPIHRCDLGPLSPEMSPLGEDKVPRDELVALLLQYRGRLSPVAKTLGVSVRTLQRRMVDYGLLLRDFRTGRLQPAPEEEES
jgi:DNA-binding NtrC family response regulator